MEYLELLLVILKTYFLLIGIATITLIIWLVYLLKDFTKPKNTINILGDKDE
jgi:hypothetical protein